MLVLVVVDITVLNVCWFWWWLVLIIANVDFEIYRSLALIKICWQSSVMLINCLVGKLFMHFWVYCLIRMIFMHIMLLGSNNACMCFV